MVTMLRRALARAFRGAAQLLEQSSPHGPPSPKEMDRMISHIAYEVAALESASSRWAGDRLVLEALLLHVRNLRDFFWLEWNATSRFAGNDLFAENYFSAAETWRRARGSKPPAVSQTWRAINSQLAHISRDRIRPKRQRSLDTVAPDLVAEVLAAWAAFLGALGADPRRTALEAEYKAWKAKFP